MAPLWVSPIASADVGDSASAAKLADRKANVNSRRSRSWSMVPPSAGVLVCGQAGGSALGTPALAEPYQAFENLQALRLWPSASGRDCCVRRSIWLTARASRLINGAVTIVVVHLSRQQGQPMLHVGQHLCLKAKGSK